MDKEIGLTLEVNLTAVTCGATEPVIKAPCFNTDVYYNGQAVEVSHHSGEVRKGLIGECTKDYMTILVVDKVGEAKKIEIDLEDYIAGAWLVKLL